MDWTIHQRRIYARLDWRQRHRVDLLIRGLGLRGGMAKFLADELRARQQWERSASGEAARRQAQAARPMSDAMREAIEEDEGLAEAREAHDARIARELAKKWRRDPDAEVREDIARFGADAVLTLRRRVDPHFTLPADLQPPKEDAK